jgi:hypothetical protein
MIGIPSQNDTKNRSGNENHPLIEAYEKKLSGLIGILSTFIVARQIGNNGGTNLVRDEAIEIACRIAEESKVLIGEERASILKDEYIRITDEYFKEGTENEGEEGN